MQALYYTAAAIVLYLASDWILQRAELAVGRRLEHRTLVFFAILLTLSLAAFAAIRAVVGA